ncbi:hypothetical protein Trydic_g12615 [Trypoxylus dichotomus]
MVESTEGNVQDQGTLVARAIVRIGDGFAIRLMNLNNYPLKLRKRTLVGNSSAISSVVPELIIKQRLAVKTLVGNYQDVFQTERK